MGDECDHTSIRNARRSTFGLSLEPKTLVEEEMEAEVSTELNDIEELCKKSSDPGRTRIKLLKRLLRKNVRERIIFKKKRQMLRYLNDSLEIELASSNQRVCELQRHIVSKHWPKIICTEIVKMETEFSFGKLYVCKHCAMVHAEPDCDADKKPYPKRAKKQNILQRRQRWLCTIREQRNNPIFLRLVTKLEKQFNEIQSKLDCERSESEKFVGSLNNVDELLYHFCDWIAKIFEHFSGVKKELKVIGTFSPPHDLFLAWFINSFVYTCPSVCCNR